MPVSIEQARAAKESAKAKLAGLPGLVGIGLTKLGKDYALKINLREELPDHIRIPKEVSGVPVCIEIVGEIKKRDPEDR